MEIELGKIEPNPWNPRTDFDDPTMEDLMESIKRFGVLQPILVRPLPTKDGAYQIVYGQRRWAACKKLGLTTIPVKEPIKEILDDDAIDMMGDENIKRKAYSPIELAKYFEVRNEILGEKQEEIAKKYGVTKKRVSEIQKLTKLPEKIKPKVSWGVSSIGKEVTPGVTPITPRHALQILKLPKEKEQIELAERVEREGLTSRRVEKEVEKILGKELEPVEEIDSGIAWTCPICKKEYRLIHVSPTNSHRFEEIPQ